jgi:hypothetical protein
LNVGYAPDGSEPRDALEFAHQMDRYASLGLPLLLSLTVPSGNVRDPHASRKSEAIQYDAEPLSPESQRRWAEAILPSLIARQPVQGILWNQLLDDQPHALAHGGLIDQQNQPKPLLEYLTKLRRDYLA